MATKGNTSLHEGIPTLADAFVVIVKTEWNAHLVDRLEKGCRKVLKSANVRVKTLVVPGAVEIPFAVKLHAMSKKPADAYITLGAVVRGDTPHFDYVCRSVTEGVTILNVSLEAPVIFGVLTVDNEQQAIERIGGVHGHKGEEAAITALKMISLARSIN